MYKTMKESKVFRLYSVNSTKQTAVLLEGMILYQSKIVPARRTGH